MPLTSLSAVVDNPLFLKNMRELWRSDPKLALALDRIDEESLPPVDQSKSGGPTLRRSTPDDRAIYLHSRYDPVSEARKWCANVAEKDKFCYFIEGFGLGYHVKQLFNELAGDIIFVVTEPDLHTLRLHT